MSAPTTIRLTRWQWQWLEAKAERLGSTVEELLRDATNKSTGPVETFVPKALPPPGQGHLLWQRTLEPHSGVALELSRGQILRVSQTTGGQCADLNFYALDAPQTPYSAGLTRNFSGPFPKVGAELLSDFPEHAPLATLITDTVEANDVLFPRCCRPVYERFFGLPEHPNCHDQQARLRAAAGIQERPVHDTFNLFMATSVDASGRMHIERNQADAGDYAELRAEQNILLLFDVCTDDLSPVNRWWQAPLHLELWAGEAVPNAPWGERALITPDYPVWEERAFPLPSLSESSPILSEPIRQFLFS